MIAVHIYKIRSGVAIDGMQKVTEDGDILKTGKVQAIHLVGNHFSKNCPASIEWQVTASLIRHKEFLLNTSEQVMILLTE